MKKVKDVGACIEKYVGMCVEEFSEARLLRTAPRKEDIMEGPAVVSGAKQTFLPKWRKPK